MTTESQRAAQSRAAKLQTVAVDRAAAELRAATETRSDEEAQAALKTVKRSPEEVAEDIRLTRAALVDTLDAIEDKINVPRRLKSVTKDLRARLLVMQEENPLGLAAIGAGAVAALVSATWFGVRALKR